MSPLVSRFASATGGFSLHTVEKLPGRCTGGICHRNMASWNETYTAATWYDGTLERGTNRHLYGNARTAAHEIWTHEAGQPSTTFCINRSTVVPFERIIVAILVITIAVCMEPLANLKSIAMLSLMKPRTISFGKRDFCYRKTLQK